MGRIVSTKELCEEAGITRQALNRYELHEDIRDVAKRGRGKWDREAALRWLAERRSVLSAQMEAIAPGPESASATTAYIEARTRLARLQGDGQQLRNRAQAGKLLIAEEVRAMLVEMEMGALAALDVWVRRGASAAAIAERQEAARELREHFEREYRAVADRLASGRDVAPSRIRLPG